MLVTTEILVYVYLIIQVGDSGA